MKFSARSLIAITIAAFAMVATMALNYSGKAAQPRVLVFSKTTGFRHQSIKEGIKAIQQLGAENGFLVDTTEDASRFTEQNLRRYAAIIFLSTTGDVLNSQQQVDFERYIQAGGGYVGIHAAADCEYDWAWYGRLVGAYFLSHPAQQKALIRVVDKSFIATQFLPDPWERFDEWYNYRNIQKDLHVLLTIDEKSYQGGKNGDFHPMAWYHEYDGGRAFYTELGHTSESYSDPLYLKHILGGIQYAIGKNKPLDYTKARSQKAPDEDRFTKHVLAQGDFDEPTEMKVFKNGDVIIVERKGAVKLYKASTGTVSQIGFLNVYHHATVPKVNAEEGVMGVAIDPKFEQNHWVYIYYAPAGDNWVNRLSRFELKNGQLNLASEKAILEVKSQREICCHTGGSLAFGPDGNLYLSTGDNSTPFDEPNQPYVNHGFAPLDDRPGHEQYDARRSAGNTNDLRGKILRIRLKADGSYEIPKGNLFPPGTPKTRPEIYVMGNRNPYRISVDQHTGYLYWGEVGPDAGNDSLNTRGPRGYDEVNQARKAGYFGWPLFVGNNYPYHQYDYATGQSGEAFNPAHPVNASRNNTGLRELPPAQPAFIWYPYAKSPDFPMVGQGGRNAMAGPVYYTADYPKATRYPSYYNGKLFIYDWIRDWIMVVTMDKEGNFEKMEPFMPGTKFSAIIDMEAGPDGRIYLLEYGKGWFTKNKDAALSRIEYNGGNRPPKVMLSANKTSGAVPFKVHLSANGSKDPDGDKLSFVWSLGHGVKKKTNTPEVDYTFAKPGDYPVFVEVFDSKGARTKSQVIDLVGGNETPSVNIQILSNKTFYFPGKAIQYKVSVSDKEDGNHLDMNNLLVKVDYLQGKDKAQIGHQTMSTVAAGKSIMEAADCKSCHKLDEKSIGPAFKEVAMKYKADAKAVDYLAGKIIRGGSGVWGETAMSAHPNIALGDARMVAEWVLSLAGNNGQHSSLPAEGSIDPQAGNRRLSDNGSFYLQAFYTDKGAPGSKPQTGTAYAELRSPLLPAESFDKAEGVSAMEVNGMKIVVSSGAQGWAVYNHLDLTDVDSLQIRYFVQEPLAYGYVVEMHLDAPGGTQLGAATIGVNAKGMQPNAATFSITPVTDGKLHDVYFTLHKADPKEEKFIALNAFRFMAK